MCVSGGLIGASVSGPFPGLWKLGRDEHWRPWEPCSVLPSTAYRDRLPDSETWGCLTLSPDPQPALFLECGRCFLFPEEGGLPHTAWEAPHPETGTWLAGLGPGDFLLVTLLSPLTWPRGVPAGSQGGRWGGAAPAIPCRPALLCCLQSKLSSPRAGPGLCSLK